MSRRRRQSQQDGFTLIEVIVAATILVVGIGATFTALAGSQRLTVKAERVDQATAIGQREIERLRALPFGDVGTTTFPTTTSTLPPLIDVTAFAAVAGGLRLKLGVPAHGEEPVTTTNGVPFSSCIAPASVPDSTACPTAGRINSGATRGTVLRVVTYATSCSVVNLIDLCAYQGDPTVQGKRVTVFVALAGVGGQTAPKPVRVDTVVASS